MVCHKTLNTPKKMYNPKIDATEIRIINDIKSKTNRSELKDSFFCK